MNLKQLAEKLNESEYGFTLEKELQTICEKEGYVVMYGHSDDLVECEGAIRDEIGAYEGTEFKFDKEGFLSSYDELDKDSQHEVKYWFQRDEKARQFKAVWHDEGNPCWTIETDVPHATFDIVEDDEVHSRGIIFTLDSL